MELEQRMEPFLKKFNLAGYHLSDIICSTSTEGIIFSLKKPGCVELVAKLKELNDLWGNTLEERLARASKEAIEMIRLCENPNVVDVVAHFALLERPPYYYCIIEKRFIALDAYLTHRLAKGPADVNLAVRLGVALCNALHSCQSFSPDYRIIHRDIKFGNIFIDETPEKGILLGDFGIAIDIVRTNICPFGGTIVTMSPEIYMSKPSNHLSDIYSVGILMYYLLNGRRYPYPDETARFTAWNDYFENEIEHFLPPPENGSELLKNIVQKAVRIKKEARWDSARSFFHELSKTEEFSQTFGIDSAYISSLGVYEKPVAPPSSEETLRRPPMIDKATSRFILSGVACVAYSDGFVYCGEWKRGYWDGSGEILYADGRLLKGTFEMGNCVSGACVTLSKGARNEWELRAHRYQKPFYTKGSHPIPDSESAIVKLSPAAVYSGGWKGGKRSGYGILFMSDGYIAEGTWDDDCFVSGSCCFLKLPLSK